MEYFKKMKQTNEYNKTETDLWIKNKLVVTSWERGNEGKFWSLGLKGTYCNV